MSTAKISSKKRRVRKRAPVRPREEAWAERKLRGVTVLQVPAFTDIPWLVHGFSTRLGGVSDVAGKYYVPATGAFLIYLVMIVLLMWRPTGLFGQRS